MQDLSARGVGLRVLAGRARRSTPPPRPADSLFGIFAALAEFERELIRERTVAGLKAARARGRKGGRKFALTKAQVRLAQAAMAHRDTSVSQSVPGARHQAGDALPVRRPAGPVAGAGPEGPRLLNRENRDAGLPMAAFWGHRGGPLLQPTRSSWRLCQRDRSFRRQLGAAAPTYAAACSANLSCTPEAGTP